MTLTESFVIFHQKNIDSSITLMSTFVQNKVERKARLKHTYIK